jgi:uncharacterized protein YbaP (TraB family)
MGGESAESRADTLLGMDMRFLLKAVAAGKNILELETYRLQIDMLDSFSPELQEAQLIGALLLFDQNADTLEEQVQTAYSEFLMLLDIIKEGDEETLGRLLGVDVEFDNPLDSEYYEKMLTNRNTGMAEKIDEYLKDGGSGDYFVIAGAAHMLGEDGLVRLLEEMGYIVERIK